jgi:hypothetical protein
MQHQVILPARVQPVPPAAISRVLARLDREQLAGFIEVAIELLDVAAGDPDLELNGDEEDGTRAEDDFGCPSANGPGCPISDPGEDGGDTELNGDEGDHSGVE